MPRKAAIYLDTSVPNALFHGPEQRTKTTRRFLDEALPDYDPFVSELVLAEVRATPDTELRAELLAAVCDYKVLSVAPEARGLARGYLRRVAMPAADALHIAIATLEGMNYLATWNMRHLAREKTRRAVDDLNFRSKLPGLFIVTPADLLD